MSEEEQIILPDGFKRVEFLQSNGNEYLYLPDLTISSNDTIEWKQQSVKNILSVDGVFSSYNYSEKPFRFAMNWGTKSLMINLFSSENNPSLDYYKSGSNFILSKNKLIIDNKTISENLKFKDDEVTGICLFTQRINNVCYNSVIKLYYWEVKGKCKLIPCLDDNNEPCMYDLVSQQAFYNQGLGRFLTDRVYELHYNLNPYTLPNGFKKCVYLQSDGTQWINTGVIPDNETGIYFKALQLSYGNFVPFGVEENGNTIYPPRFSSKDLYYKWGETSVKMMTWDNTDDLIFQSSLNFYNSKIAFFNSEDTDHLEYLSSQSGIFAYPIWLFSYNVNGSFLTTYGAWTGRIYRAQITQGNTLIRDYIPCLDADGRPCMWDSINGVSYYNQSGGIEFTYCVEYKLPSDFSKLKYLESTGTQYIKTGYVPTNTTGLYVDCFNNSKVTSSAVPMGLRDTNGNTYFASPRTAKNSDAGYGWGTFTNWGGKGDVRFEGTTNWLNDRKAIITSPAFAQKSSNLSDLSFTPTKDIYIFGIHNYDGKYLSGSWKFYRAKISEGSEVVRDFVPAFDTEQQRPCMYDLINAQAFYNEGTGEFDYFPKETNYTSFCQLGVIGNRLGTGEDGLPPTYKRVNYLQSTGTQYIDTGIATDGTYTIRTKMQLSSGSAWGRAFKTADYDVGGSSFCRHSITSGYYCMNFLYYWNGGVYGNRTGYTDVEWDINEPNVWEALEGVKSAKVNGYDSRIRGFNTLKVDASNPNNLTHYIFWANGVFTNGNAKGIMKLYDFQMINGSGKIVLDLIPCLDTKGTPCMFDRIANKTFYNQGTGEFIYG